MFLFYISVGNKIFLAFYFTKRTFKSDETYSFKAVFRGRIFQKKSRFCAKNGTFSFDMIYNGLM